MAKAISPMEMPFLPEGAVEWRRSARRGGVYHARGVLGDVACKSLQLDRFKSVAAKDLSDMRYWGVCSRCYLKAN